MKKLFFLIIFIIITAGVYAQKMALGDDYKTAIGVKIYPGAISVKTFTKDDLALEGLLYFWNYGTRFTGLYEIHRDITGVDGLKYYLGPGAHIGVWNNHWNDKYPSRNDGVMFGVDGVIGLDYKINGAPIDVSIDWQPSFNFVGYSYFEGGWGGLGVRYAF